MKKILFLRGREAYLPEIAAYKKHLEQFFSDVHIYDSAQLKDFNLNDFDIIWRFMGMDTEGEGRYVVHEYNSLSAGQFPRIKNAMKRLMNARPDRRVFLNDIVRKDFFFSDDVPYTLRDMGVSQKFFEQAPAPEYDFVYAGSIHRGNEVLRMLAHFAATPGAGSLLIIGAVNAETLSRYKPYKNIAFTGPVPYEDVSALMAKGRYGLNLIPDCYPFRLQTVTKVLEYSALGLPVVSTRYPWIENFMKNSGGKAFWLDKDFSNLSSSAVESADLKAPDVTHLQWGRVIEASGVFDFLKGL